MRDDATIRAGAMARRFLRSGALAALALLLAGPAVAQAPARVAEAGTAIPNDTTRRLLPLMQEWRPAAGSLTLGARGVVAIGANPPPALAAEAARLAEDLRATTGAAWTVETRDAQAGDIGLRLRAADAAAAGGGTTEGYRTVIGDAVAIEAGGAAGLFYGGRTLLQMIRLSADHARPTLPRGAGSDRPTIAMRAAMLDLGRHYFEMENLLAFIRTLGERKMNVLHLHFNDWRAFRLDSPRYPGLAPAGASYDRADVRRLEAEAARNHVTIIPEIDLPAHAVALTDYRPQLGFRCPSMRTSSWLRHAAPDIGDKAWTVDVTRAENRRWLTGLLDEFIPWFSGPYFHVGGDEYQFDDDKERCPELVAAAKRMGLKYTGDVMIKWLDEANATVKAHGKRTVAWSWWGFRNDKTSIAPSRDIVVEVWNPNMADRIIAAGHDVILSPEDELYVTPGEALVRKDDYGVFDLAATYGQQAFQPRPQVLGYSLSIWADGAERHTDGYFTSHAAEPMMVMSERLWTGAPRSDVWNLLARANVLDARRRSAAGAD